MIAILVLLACAPPLNHSPQARFRVGNAIAGEQVTLDASNSSDPDGNFLNVQWRVTDPDGRVLDLPDRPRVNFPADRLGSWDVELEVDDGWLNGTTSDGFHVLNERPEVTTTLWVGDEARRVQGDGGGGVYLSHPDLPPISIDINRTSDADHHEVTHIWETSWPISASEAEAETLDVPNDGPGSWVAELILTDGWETTTLTFDLNCVEF